MADNNDRYRYNFDYFDQMNQKEAARQQAEQKQKKARPQQPRKKGKEPPKKEKKQAKQPQPSKEKPRPQLPAQPVRGQPAAKDAMAASQPKKKKEVFQAKDPLPKKSKRTYETPEERKRVMRRRKILVAMGGAFGVIIVAMILCLTVFFKIDNIEVIGASRYSADQIIEASNLESGKHNLFTLNEGKVEEAIVTSLPYVNTVSISRHLPGTITMEVSDVTVVGAVQTSGGYVIIGTNGKMLELLEKKPDNCPLLIGATLTKTELGEQIEYENEQQKEALDAFAKALQDGEIDKITGIDITDLYSIKATYDNRIMLEFGMPTDMEFKIRFIKATLDSGKIGKSEKGTLDASLAVDKNRVYFDPDYTVDTGDDKDKNKDKDKDKDNTSSTSSDSDTDSDDDTDNTDDGDDNGIPDGYTQDADGFYYGEDGYYDSEGNFTAY